MDRITKSQRSRIMAAVKSRGNISTELAVVKIFRKEKITSWRRHQKIFNIRPDFVFSGSRIAIFVNGCFWHGCKLHRSIPVANKQFWSQKIAVNKNRDLRVKRKLKDSGWRVLYIWEHELRRDLKKVVSKVQEMIKLQSKR